MAPQGRDHCPCGVPSSGFQHAVFQLNGGFEPPLDVQQRPWAVGVFSYRSQKKLMWNRVKEGTDSKIEPPSVTPAMLSRDTHCPRPRGRRCNSSGLLTD